MSNNHDIKLKTVMNIIDEIAESNDEVRMNELEAKLREITGRTDINASDYFEYWGRTDLEDLAKTFLMLIPIKNGLDDEQLAEIIIKICECQYSESETDYQINVLEKETGLYNVSDYIFFPDTVGLSCNATISEIIEKILADRKNN